MEEKGSPNGGKGWFPRRKPMGSSKETTGFLTGTYWLPTALIVVPGIGLIKDLKRIALLLQPFNGLGQCRV